MWLGIETLLGSRRISADKRVGEIRTELHLLLINSWLLFKPLWLFQNIGLASSCSLCQLLLKSDLPLILRIIRHFNSCVYENWGNNNHRKTNTISLLKLGLKVKSWLITRCKSSMFLSCDTSSSLASEIKLETWVYAQRRSSWRVSMYFKGNPNGFLALESLLCLLSVSVIEYVCVYVCV